VLSQVVVDIPGKSLGGTPNSILRRITIPGKIKRM
jgi:hypothetical protein